MSDARHGLTSHGHHCCDKAPAGKPPFARARCGGPILCSHCRGDISRIHAAPRSWALPDQPGPEVTHLRDRAGQIWFREGDWWSLPGHPFGASRIGFGSLLVVNGPLTDATPLAASPLSEEKGASGG